MLVLVLVLVCWCWCRCWCRRKLLLKLRHGDLSLREQTLFDPTEHGRHTLRIALLCDVAVLLLVRQRVCHLAKDLLLLLQLGALLWFFFCLGFFCVGFLLFWVSFVLGFFCFGFLCFGCFFCFGFLLFFFLISFCSSARE